MKKSISFILVFVITLINFSYAFTTESNETSMDTHKEEILNDVYEQLKLQGVEDQFDKWVKEDVERILENDNSGNQKLLKSQRSSSKYAPNGAAVSYKDEYANTVHIYLNGSCCWGFISANRSNFHISWWIYWFSFKFILIGVLEYIKNS